MQTTDWRSQIAGAKCRLQTEFKMQKTDMGVARIFQGGVTLCQNEGTHQIVMSTSTPCFGFM